MKTVRMVAPPLGKDNYKHKWTVIPHPHPLPTYQKPFSPCFNELSSGWVLTFSLIAMNKVFPVCYYNLKVSVLIPPKFTCWNLFSSSVKIFAGRGAFKRWLDHEGEALMNGVSTFLKDTLENSSSLQSSEDSAGRCHLWTRKWGLTRNWLC